MDPDIRDLEEFYRTALKVIQQERELLTIQKKMLAQQRQVIKRRSAWELRSFLDSIPALIMHVKDDQRVAFCNLSCRAFLGQTMRQLAGKHIWEVFPMDYETLRPHLLESLAGHEVRFEQSFHGKVERYFHATATPDRTSGDGAHGALIFGVDISERKALEEERRRQEQLKDNFLAMLSHELRTPLTPILGWIQLINSHSVSGQQAEAGLATIERNARIQIRLIEELLDFSRMISGKMTLELTPVDVCALVEETVNSFRPTFIEKRLGIHLKLFRGAAEIKGDRVRLQQVVSNLLANSIKFTPPDGRIDVTLQKARRAVEIVVQDTGQGIARTFLPHVFEEFRQSDMSSERKHGGLGLGLAIARKIVQLHHGSIEASSRGPGKGATFTVTLPRDKAA